MSLRRWDLLSQAPGEANYLRRRSVLKRGGWREGGRRPSYKDIPPGVMGAYPFAKFSKYLFNGVRCVRFRLVTEHYYAVPTILLHGALWCFLGCSLDLGGLKMYALISRRCLSNTTLTGCDPLQVAFMVKESSWKFYTILSRPARSW